MYWSPVNLGPHDYPLAIAIVPSTTVTDPNQEGKKLITLPVECHAAVRADAPQPGTLESTWRQAETILGDIKRAIELDDKTLGGLAADLAAGESTPIPREEGSQTVGLLIEYRVLYTELWGNPDK
jgi:hypothetical protein